MRIKELSSDKYLLLDAGEIWDLEISDEDNVSIFLKPVETDFQIGAKQYIDGLLKMKIKNLEEEISLSETIKEIDYLIGQLDFAKDFYNNLEWREEHEKYQKEQ